MIILHAHLYCRYVILPTVDAKAAALILFALKLVFGLDDKREYNMTKKVCLQSFDSGLLFLRKIIEPEVVWREDPNGYIKSFEPSSPSQSPEFVFQTSLFRRMR